MAREKSNGNSDGNNVTENTGDRPSTIIDGDVITASGIDTNVDGSDQRVINPGDIISGEPDASDGNTSTKRRGRPRGSKNSTRTAARKETAQDLSGVLFSVHLMLAKLTGIEELEIDDDESKKLSAAVVRVNELYDGIVVPEKVLAWIALASTCGGIYGPRFAAHSLRKKNEAKKNPVTIDIPIVQHPMTGNA